MEIEGRYEIDPETGCWEWKGTKDRKGYGVYSGERAHRAAWERYNGPIQEGLFVCHHCDNPGCINPEHLFLGTHQDNMTDKVKKNRAGRRFTPEQVLELRKLHDSGMTWEQLAALKGVSVPTIYRALAGRMTYKGI